jgi:protein TonB
MGHPPSDRVRRSVAAGIVLLTHVALVWLFVLPRMERVEQAFDPEPVIATIIEPRPRALSFGPVAIEVKTENVVHLQRLAPKVQDIPVELPEPVPQTAETVPDPASAPVPQLASAGMNGITPDVSGQSGGGTSITLLQRVIPKYPIAAARRQQEGATSVLLRVDPTGRVQDVKITRSSGSRVLDTAAVRAFRQWKFAPGSAPPQGLWVKTEQRFILYRLKYSRLGGKAVDNVDVATLQTASPQMTPGSEEVLRRFIDRVRAGTYAPGSSRAARTEIDKLHDAIEEWGPVKSIEFTGNAGPHRWIAYRVGAEQGREESTVEVQWNLFEVIHEHETTEWLVAVDREGEVWAARASPAPWL